ncbi:hypothetical protein KW786_00285 [Candidatus Parcubacteria bacterium]|nr:hypothetical protein [Candidatus Parcubacteria bacterium]
MAKKLYDIVPPGARKKANTVKEIAAVKEVKKKRAPRSVKSVKPSVLPPVPPTGPSMMPPPLPPKRGFPVKEVVAGVLVIAALACVYGYIKLPKADIDLWPSTAALTLSEKVTANTSTKTVDDSSKLIPAQYIEVSKDVEQTFPATGSGSEDGKATGTIIVYNKISPAAPFTLIKGTHFLSDSGKYFLTLDKIVIPAAKGKTPGSVNVRVQAEQSGVDYNIGASKFSIPKLNGTVYYYSLYGQSTTEMQGGYTGKVKKVTSDDLQSAKEVVTKKALAAAEDALKASLTDDQVLLDGAVTAVVVESSADAKASAVVNEFKEHVKAKAFAMVFKKQDMDVFVQKYIKSHIPQDNSMVPNTLDVKTTFQSFDADKKVLQVALDLGLKTYQTVDADALTGLLPVKTADQVKEIVDQLYPNTISQLKVNFWPFWVHKVPSNSKRIKVNLQFE